MGREFSAAGETGEDVLRCVLFKLVLLFELVVCLPSSPQGGDDLMPAGRKFIHGILFRYESSYIFVIDGCISNLRTFRV